MHGVATTCAWRPRDHCAVAAGLAPPLAVNDTRANEDLPLSPDAGARDGAPARTSPSPCHNCGADAPGAYCSACGQETRLALPTVRELMRDATGRLVAVDGRLWRTLFVLLFRPGMLTQEYLRGRRKRYVRPARLFFFMSLLLFAAIRFLEPPTKIVILDLTDERPAAEGATPAASGASASTAGSGVTRQPATVRGDPDIEDLIARFGKYVPAEMRVRMERFKSLSTEEQADHLYSGLMRYAPYGMVALLPAFAFLGYLAYLPGSRRHPRRPRRYAEHLVYGAHLHAFVFLMIIAMLVVPKILQAALAVWIVIYVVRARQKVYGGSWLAGLLRTVPIALAYIALLGVVMSTLIALSVATR
jgi:hypothetical protein